MRSWWKVETKILTRGAGILISIASLPAVYGTGTLGSSAYNFVKLLADLRQKYWQVSSLDTRYLGDNPWQSFSAFAGNPYLVDQEELVRIRLLEQQELECLINRGGGESASDLHAVYMQLLQKAFKRFDSENDAFMQFCRDNEAWLDDYSFFMAAKSFSGGKKWYEWEPGLRNREAAVMERYRVALQEQILFWKFCQYQFFQQWRRLRKYVNARGIQLIGDLPFYMEVDCADVWAHRSWFMVDADGCPTAVSASPSERLEDIWRNRNKPLYEWAQMEREDFSWWKQRMRMAGAMYDVIRIDHFSDIMKYYSVSPAFPRRGGSWNKGPGKKLLEVMAKAAGGCRIVSGETEVASTALKKLIAKNGWLEMRALELAFNGSAANEHLPHNYKNTNIVVYTGSGDKDGIVGYYRNRPEYEMSFLYQYLGIGLREDIADAFIRTAYSSVADVVIVQMRDILKKDGQNTGYLSAAGAQDWKWELNQDGLTMERRSWIRTLAMMYRR